MQARKRTGPSDADQGAPAIPEVVTRLLTPIPVPEIDPCDMQVAQALGNARAASNDGGQTRLDAISEQHLSFRLPLDWNGELQIRPVIEGVGKPQEVEGLGQAGPGAFGIHARLKNGRYAWLIDCATRTRAQEIVNRLAVIDAFARDDDLERLAAFARIHEQHVLLDPDSTPASIAAARVTRQWVEILAIRP